MLGTDSNGQIELERRDAAKPVGDFMAQVSSAIAVMLCFLTFYSGPETYKGYETPYGIILIIAGFVCWLFASGVLVEKCIRKDFWLSRSPGWLYGLAASIIVIVSLLAMLFPFREDPNLGVMGGTLFTGFFIMFGSMLKF